MNTTKVFHQVKSPQEGESIKRLHMAFALLSLLLVASAFGTSSRAADYTKVGVHAGDWAAYSFSVRSSGQGATGSAHIEITQVIGTYVGVSYTVTYSGQSVTNTYSGDISTGEDSICSYVIAANLSAGDPLYEASPFLITETTTRYVGGASRLVNHVAMTMSGTSIDIWYDRATGMIMEESYETSSMSISISATSTSLFPADPISPLVFGGIGVVVVIVGVVIILGVRASRREKVAEGGAVVAEAGSAGGSAKRTEAKGSGVLSIAPICPHCGAEIAPGASFCDSCGASLAK